MNAISQISSDMSAAMAVDLASNMWSEADVFANHGLDPIRGAELLQQEWFRKMVDEARREWSSISNAKDRIKLKSQVAVEQAIGDLYAIVVDKDTPASARVAAFKELKDTAGVVVQESTGPASNAPSVNIFLNGADVPAVSIQASSVEKEAVEADIIDVTPSNPDDGLELAPL